MATNDELTTMIFDLERAHKSAQDNLTAALRDVHDQLEQARRRNHSNYDALEYYRKQLRDITIDRYGLSKKLKLAKAEYLNDLNEQAHTMATHTWSMMNRQRTKLKLTAAGYLTFGILIGAAAATIIVTYVSGLVA